MRAAVDCLLCRWRHFSRSGGFCFQGSVAVSPYTIVALGTIVGGGDRSYLSRNRAAGRMFACRITCMIGGPTLGRRRVLLQERVVVCCASLSISRALRWKTLQNDGACAKKPRPASQQGGRVGWPYCRRNYVTFVVGAGTTLYQYTSIAPAGTALRAKKA